MFWVSACSMPHRSAIRQKHIEAARRCWITAVWKQLCYFSPIFRKQFVKTLKAELQCRCCMSCSSILAWPDLCVKCRFCLKPRVGEANMPTSHLSSQIELVIHLSIHHPTIYTFPRCVTDPFTVAELNSNFIYRTFSPRRVSRFDPVLFQTIYYSYIRTHDVPKIYTCFLMLLLVNLCKIEFSLLNVCHPQTT